MRAGLSIGYLGTPKDAVVPLKALVGAGYEVRLVVTGPDRRRSRRGRLEPTPVKQAASELGIQVSEDVEDLVDSGVDLGVVVAFGRIIKRDVLEQVPIVNLHFSLLPRWRGAAPVERAILAGDKETGVCLMSLDEGLDTGPVHECRSVEIGDQETAGHLRGRLAELGSHMLLEWLETFPEGLAISRPQVGEATYAPKIDPGELCLRWDCPAEKLARVVRVGRAWTMLEGSRIAILEARAAEGSPGVLVPSLRDCQGEPHEARAAEGSGHLLGRPAACVGYEPGVSQLPGTVHLDSSSGTVWVATGRGRLELSLLRPQGRATMNAADWLRGLRRAGPIVLGQ